MIYFVHREVTKQMSQKNKEGEKTMKNNKGFSLVELIIVIAIMAILVGVMAPQLIKYIEKTNVSSDTQLADTVCEAIITAMMDPAVITQTGYTQPTGGTLSDSTLGSCAGAVKETLGIPDTGDAGDIAAKLKSKGHSTIEFTVNGENSVTVTLPGTSSTAKTGGPEISVTR